MIPSSSQTFLSRIFLPSSIACPSRCCMIASSSVASCPPPQPPLQPQYDLASKPRVLVIAGPTAVGKSAVALEVAKRVKGEIIGADSVQVYKGLDVGSAKTALKDRQGVPHHLIDIIEPSEVFCAGDYFSHSREATTHVLSKRHVPIVVGGTGFYLHWYVYGKPDTPKSTPESQASVDMEFTELLNSGGNWDDALQLLMRAGDTSAAIIPRNDWYRLRRSFEIIKATGLPRTAYVVPSPVLRNLVMSDASEDSTSFLPPAIEDSNIPELDYNFICFFLCTSRSKLYRCIDLRCEEMLTGTMGLIREASWLLNLGIIPNTNPVSRAIGYRQAMEYLMECRDAGGSSSQDHFFSFLSDFQRASRRYAKRQLTWFRNEPLYHWIDASQPLGDVVELILNVYKDPSIMARAPETGLIWKDASHEEKKQLKAYRTQNRHFVNHDDCNQVLEWIKRTQCHK